jgi:acetylornithine/succinyldiaminopimelate/putrescine aminotransferase
LEQSSKVFGTAPLPEGGKNMFFSDLKKLDQEYIAGTYGRVDLDIQSGGGVVCRDAAGREYIDFPAASA